MERTTYCVYPGESAAFGASPELGEARVQMLGMDKEVLPGCMVTAAGWYKEDCFDSNMVKHESNEVLMLLGSDRNHPNDLNAEVEIWIENDKFVLDQCCAVFIPAGAAHGGMAVRNLKAPVAYYYVQTDTDTYAEVPAEPTAPEGAYANHYVERFEPSSGYMPNAPEGLLTPLVWIDGGRIPNAPYGEAVWFNINSEEGPEAHTHEYGEFLSFFGTDPENPEDLGCVVEFYLQGERIDIEQSCLMYIPAGVAHGPFYIRNMVRPILHTSGYAGTNYQRTAQE